MKGSFGPSPTWQISWRREVVALDSEWKAERGSSGDDGSTCQIIFSGGG